MAREGGGASSSPFSLWKVAVKIISLCSLPTSPLCPEQIYAEIRGLRRFGCSFEPPMAAEDDSERSAAMTTGSSNGAGHTVSDRLGPESREARRHRNPDLSGGTLYAGVKAGGGAVIGSSSGGGRGSEAGSGSSGIDSQSLGGGIGGMQGARSSSPAADGPSPPPSWNQCFKCLFTCGLYRNASATTALVPRGVRQAVQRQRRPRDCMPSSYARNGIVRRGLYAYQLQHWLRFFPPEQIMVLNHEQVRKCGGVRGEWGCARTSFSTGCVSSPRSRSWC